MTEWRRRNPKRSTTEMGQENQRSCSRALQRQASFIANRGWKSSNSSPLSVGGELFPLTSPFIEQAITLRTPAGGILSEMAIFQHLTRYLVVELESDRGESEHIYGCGGRFRSRL